MALLKRSSFWPYHGVFVCSIDGHVGEWCVGGQGHCVATIDQRGGGKSGRD